jgi:hypothetical protein
MHSASGGDFFRHEIVRLHQTVGHNHGRYAINRLAARLRTMVKRMRL